MQRSTHSEEKHTSERFEPLLGEPLSHFQNGMFIRQDTPSPPSLFKFNTGQLRKWTQFVTQHHDPGIPHQFMLLYYDAKRGVAVFNGAIKFYNPEYIRMYSEVISDS